MKIIRSQQEEPFQHKTVVTIGTFDGVHIGHQKIVKRLVQCAKNEQLQATVLTFFPHPRMVLQQDADIKLINTLDERTALLKQFGLNVLYVKKFDKAFSRLSAEDFVKQLLVNTLNAQKVIIGYDHRFGRNRSANIDDLRQFGEQYGFEVEDISAQDVDEVAVSSTKIRTALLDGDVSTANTYLGYNFMLNGTVVKGRQMGAKLGFPTANIHVEETYKLVPKHGAYVVKSKLEGQTVYGMMNIGVNPTVAGEKESIEAHFFDFNKDLYGKTIQVELLKRIRDEQKFGSTDALKAQLERDKLFSIKYLSEI